MIVLPPLDEGADHVTVARALPAVALTLSGTPAALAGTVDAEGSDGFPVPLAFVAVTVNVYESPFVRPPTLHLSGPLDHVQVCMPLAGVVESAAVTVYFVMAFPPFTVGAVQLTCELASPEVAATFRGMPGYPKGVVPGEDGDGLLVPSTFVAVTLNV